MRRNLDAWRTSLAFTQAPVAGSRYQRAQAGIFALTHHSESARHMSNRHGALHVDLFSGTHSPTTPSVNPAPGGEQSVTAR